jgi:hypothetical protein
MAHNNDNTRSKLKHTDNSFSDETLKLAQCLMPEPPTAKVKRMVASIVADKGIDRQIHEMGWKAYDTVIGAANNVTNRAFTSPAVGQVIGGAVDIMLRWQRLNAAVAGAFFSALWPAVGLPSATELEGMRRDVRAMREELRDAIADRESKENFADELHVAIRESIVNQHAEDKSSAREPNGGAHAEVPATAKKSSVHQFSVWSGWPGADPTEAGEDVGN